MPLNDLDNWIQEKPKLQLVTFCFLKFDAALLF